jgi:hypothetical protein
LVLFWSDVVALVKAGWRLVAILLQTAPGSQFRIHTTNQPESFEGEVFVHDVHFW